ncbi:MAG: hypothetical protein E7613_07205 [Ruminococcaceae bacterium]|nr:hypothetical protein [Oscillospiraceae bacterium]
MDEKNDVMQKNAFNKKALLIPFIVALIGSLLLILVTFLPFASANEEHKDYLEEYSGNMYVQEIDMTNEDAVDISLYEYGRIYAAATDIEMVSDIAITCLVIICIYGLFSVLVVLFSLLKKAIPIIVFDVLALADFLLIKWDFSDRGILPNFNYNWGVAQIICYIAFAITMVGAIWLLVEKIKIKSKN